MRPLEIEVGKTYTNRGAGKDETLLMRCRKLKRAGDKVAAVKLYRAEKRCALKPAMDAIDAL